MPILLPAGKRLKTSQQEAARSGVREHVGRFRVRARLQMLQDFQIFQDQPRCLDFSRPLLSAE